ncbi:hypothetical protein A2U01_0105906, partial [Trifolium medium]|nr:hypothetical protein [Trifolium medium]
MGKSLQTSKRKGNGRKREKGNPVVATDEFEAIYSAHRFDSM